MVVAEKWTGTDQDRRDMRKLKLNQVVRRNFSRLAMFGFSTTLICTWEVILISLPQSLGNGGTAGLFWTYLITVVGLTLVYLSIAELGSMLPTAGGQYYWVAVLAPKSCRKYLSYITGWLCTTAWQSMMAAAAFISGIVIQGIFTLSIPNYNPQRWHGTLLAIAIASIAIVFNTLLARKLPLVEGLLVFFHVLGVVIVIPLLVLAPRRVGGGPLVEFWNPGGWKSDGLATMVGMLPTVIALIGFDCNIHMSEETKDSARTVPVSLLSGFGANAILGFFTLMTCIYTIGPLDVAITESPTGWPFMDMFLSATGSVAAASFMSSIVVLNFTAATIANLATASRQLWAFARNHGVPFSRFFAPTSLTYDIPVTALIFTIFITILLSLINIGSTTALNAIFAIATGSLITSYMITIGCVLLIRLRGYLPQSQYSLGKHGIWINIASLIYLAPLQVFSFFPTTPHPTPETMNWAIVMYGGVIIFATIYYIIYGRHTFTPPNYTFEDLLARSGNKLHSDNEAGVRERGDSDRDLHEVVHEVRDKDRVLN